MKEVLHGWRLHREWRRGDRVCKCGYMLNTWFKPTTCTEDGVCTKCGELYRAEVRPHQEASALIAALSRPPLDAEKVADKVLAKLSPWSQATEVFAAVVSTIREAQGER